MPKEMTLKLSPAEINFIGALLREQPYKQVVGLIDKIQAQLDDQQKPVQPDPAPEAASA